MSTPRWADVEVGAAQAPSADAGAQGIGDAERPLVEGIRQWLGRAHRQRMPRRRSVARPPWRWLWIGMPPASAGIGPAAGITASSEPLALYLPPGDSTSGRGGRGPARPAEEAGADRLDRRERRARTGSTSGRGCDDQGMQPNPLYRVGLDDVRALASLGIRINSISDVTPVPHNGCRPQKRRRI